MSRLKKVRQTETPSQAAHFQRLLSAGLDTGLCQVCAAQWAYGRQHGFLQVKPPCTTCHPIAASQVPRWAYAQGRESSAHVSESYGAGR